MSEELIFNVGTLLRINSEPGLFGEILGSCKSLSGIVYDVIFWNNKCNFHYRTDVFHETISENLECGFYSIVYKNENF